jgi:hypothetical protein
VRLLVDAIQTCYFVLSLFISFQFKGDISEEDRTLFQHLSFLEQHFCTSGFLWVIVWLLFRLRSSEFLFLICLHGSQNETCGESNLSHFCDHLMVFLISFNVYIFTFLLFHWNFVTLEMISLCNVGISLRYSVLNSWHIFLTVGLVSV